MRIKKFKMPKSYGIYYWPEFFLNPSYGVSPCIRWLRWKLVWGKRAKEFKGYNPKII